MDLRQFRYFIEVADRRSFTKAAQRLHISQPTLSQQIRALEQALGINLLVRSASGIDLTQAGIAFLDRARAAIREATAAVEDARAASAGFLGRLSIACGPLAEYCILHDVLELARSKSPKLSIRLRFLPENEQILGVLAGTADVGFMGFFSETPDPHLKYEPLYPERGIVMLPARHRFASRRAVKLSELAEDSWIIPTRDQSPFVHDVFLAECEKAGFAPKINVSADWYSRFPLVASGAGVCVGASALLKFRRPKIKFIPLEPSVTVNMGMITKREDNSAQLDEFRGLVKEALALRVRELQAEGRTMRS
jgi:DNA-binding transcriptional LysR family regulator